MPSKARMTKKEPRLRMKDVPKVKIPKQTTETGIQMNPNFRTIIAAGTSARMKVM